MRRKIPAHLWTCSPCVFKPPQRVACFKRGQYWWGRPPAGCSPGVVSMGLSGETVNMWPLLPRRASCNHPSKAIMISLIWFARVIKGKTAGCVNWAGLQSFPNTHLINRQVATNGFLCHVSHDCRDICDCVLLRHWWTHVCVCVAYWQSGCVDLGSVTRRSRHPKCLISKRRTDS